MSSSVRTRIQSVDHTGIIKDNLLCTVDTKSEEDMDSHHDTSSEKEPHDDLYDTEGDTTTGEIPPSSPSLSSSSSSSPTSMDNTTTNNNNGGKAKSYTRTIVALLVLSFVIFVIVDSLTNKFIKTGIQDFMKWVEENPTSGFFVFIVVVFLTTILFIPGVILTIGAGFVFGNASHNLGLGIFLGTVAVSIGAFAGAIVSFLLGRFLLRDCVSNCTQKFKIMAALDTAFEEKGFRIMVLLRLSPLIYNSPYLNYGAGGTALSFVDFVRSLFIIIPATIVYIFVGASAESLSASGSKKGSQSKTVTTVVLVVGIVFSALGMVVATWYARKELNKIASNDEQEEQPHQERQDDVDVTVVTIHGDDPRDIEDPKDVEQGSMKRIGNVNLHVVNDTQESVSSECE